MKTLKATIGARPRLKVSLEASELSTRFGHPIIKSGGRLTEIAVASGAADAVYDPPEDCYGFSRVLVEGDADLIPKNIRSGVEILGVTGNFGGGENIDISFELTKAGRYDIGPFILALTGTPAGTAALGGVVTTVYPCRSLGTYTVSVSGGALDGIAAVSGVSLALEDET